MKLLDDIIYYPCCLIVVLHSLSAILVVTHGRCTVYAAAFLVACAMWISLTALNLWFFLPAIVQSAPEIVFDLTGDWSYDASEVARKVWLSTAASHTCMMLVGWSVGSMSVSNALSMWQREGCDARDVHCHPGVGGKIVGLARRYEIHVGINDVGYMLFAQEHEKSRHARSSWFFMVPRLLHRYYLLLLSPPIRLLAENHQRKGVEEMF
ncbi:hypothetical protein BJ170DRAFT_618106 [Xylariales sp. AK1849]|nr:hypothetical protein BJ170DRAFT_618106 [Xylariales sp. AK1849]